MIPYDPSYSEPATARVEVDRLGTFWFTEMELALLRAYADFFELSLEETVDYLVWEILTEIELGG